jgi:hypothetical protein
LIKGEVMTEKGWYTCKCGNRYFHPYKSDFSIYCKICPDNPRMELEKIEYHYYFRELPTNSNCPTSFEILASLKGKGCCRAKFPILFDDYYMAKRFCEVMNNE